MNKADFLSLLDEYQKRQYIMPFIDWDNDRNVIVARVSKDRIKDFNIFDTFKNDRILEVWSPYIPKTATDHWDKEQKNFISNLT